jgi:hypothetical protein
VSDPEPLSSDVFKETAVTERVADIGLRDEEFTVALARALLSTAAAQEDRELGGRAAELLRHVPDTGLQLRREVAYTNRTIDIFLRGFGERTLIDWLFDGESFALAVEVKTRPSGGMESRQLLRYHVALTARRSKLRRPTSGVLALTPYDELFGHERLKRRRERYIGAIRWVDAMPGLRTVVPADPADAAWWSSVLDYLEPQRG